MRLVFDAWGLGSGQGGDETLAESLVAGIETSVAADHDVTLLVRREVRLDPATERAMRVVRVASAPGTVHYGVDLPRHLRRIGPDLALTTNHAALRGSAPSALLLTDLSFLRRPDLYPRSTRIRFGILAERQAKAAALVLTISEFCRQDIIGAFDLPADRVAVVPPAIAPPTPWSETLDLQAQTWLGASGIDRPFLLYLGNLHPRKNLVGLLHGYARARRQSEAVAGTQLVVAGARWWGDDERTDAPRDGVVFLGRVSNGQREGLLRRALGLAYLSVFEGFGLPPLEAMARATPVLASNTTAIPETAGDAALLVDPMSTEAIARGIAQLVEDDALRADLAARGPARAALYDVDRTGAALRQALMSVGG